MKTIKILELFAGIGATSTALKNLGYEVEYYGVVENNKKVINCFNSIHGTNFDAIDITQYFPKWEFMEQPDLLVAGFPCQPFSLAGKGLGFDDPRGKMFKEVLRIIETIKPDNIILENVKGILQEKNRWIIQEIINFLERQGYKIEVKLVNAKDFIPQNRERVFILGARISFFPAELSFNRLRDYVEVKKRTTVLKDFLDKEVSEEYYYDAEKIKRVLEWKAQEKPLDRMVQKKRRSRQNNNNANTTRNRFYAVSSRLSLYTR